VDIGAPVVADGKTPELAEPGQRPFDLLSMTPHPCA
jgi:hypothetical protein